MNRTIPSLTLVVLIVVFTGITTTCRLRPVPPPEYVLVVHGGAGDVDRDHFSPERATAVRAGIRRALAAGSSILTAGGSAVDAVKAAIRELENDPAFNAGQGAVFNADGIIELDASIMDGRDRTAGAAAGLQHVRNPIDLADAVRTASDHVLLTGAGAEEFARRQGLPLEENSYFFTEQRRSQLERWRQQQEEEMKEPAPPATPGDERPGDGLGTVGAVALDRRGNLAAGTSTGGMTAKRFGRVGDSPIIGAGTWADNRTCAVSATGHGEYFIRYVAAYDVHARMLYQNLPLATAARQVVMRQLKAAGGNGGMVCLDNRGRVATPCNQNYMARGVATANGQVLIRLFMDE